MQIVCSNSVVRIGIAIAFRLKFPPFVYMCVVVGVVARGCPGKRCPLGWW